MQIRFMRKFFLLLQVVSISAIIYAQPVIKVYHQTDFHKGFRILADNKNNVGYTVELTFSIIAGYRISDDQKTGIFRHFINGPKNSQDETIIFTIPAQTIGQLVCILNRAEAPQHSFHYNHKSYKGISINNPDTTFTYLIPALADHEVTTFHTYYIGEVIGKDKPGYYSAGFRFHRGDTICAARTGTVYEASDTAQQRIKDEFYNIKTHNHINIEQPDGTLAHYTIASKIKLLVHEGDKIIAGQPIAVFSSEDFNYPLIFSVTNLNLNNPPDEEGSYHSTIHTYFYTEQNPAQKLEDKKTYKSVHPAEIITKELTKKEIKRLGLKKE
jgi:Peptidase family M23